MMQKTYVKRKEYIAAEEVESISKFIVNSRSENSERIEKSEFIHVNNEKSDIHNRSEVVNRAGNLSHDLSLSISCVEKSEIISNNGKKSDSK